MDEMKEKKKLTKEKATREGIRIVWLSSLELLMVGDLGEQLNIIK